MWRGGQRIFPVGLYATLFVGTCLLLMPGMAGPVEGWLRAVVCLPLKVYGRFGTETRAAAHTDRLLDLDAFLAAEARTALAFSDDLPIDGTAEICRVTAAFGDGRWPSRLRLDRTNRELEGVHPYVTHGDALIGFLASGAPDAKAEVSMLHNVVPRDQRRRVRASVVMPGGPLGCLLEPAAAIDPWPLRLSLVDDPYRAAGLNQSGLEVVTASLTGPTADQPPAGLLLGRLHVIGYPERGIVISLHVEPARDPFGLSVVVMHRFEASVRRPHTRPTEGGRLLPAVLTPLPVRRGERWYVHVEGMETPRPSSALVRGDALVGIVVHGGPGHGIAVPLAGGPGPTSFLVLPEGGGAILPVRGRLFRGSDGQARLQVHGTHPGPGLLFSGVSTPDCPAGLRIGRVIPDLQQDDLLRVALEPAPATGAVSVFFSGER